MGGDDSQKLLPWRGISVLSGAQPLLCQRSITLPQTADARPDTEPVFFPAVPLVLSPPLSGIRGMVPSGPAKVAL